MNTALVHCLLKFIRDMDDTISSGGGANGLEFAKKQVDGALARDGNGGTMRGDVWPVQRHILHGLNGRREKTGYAENASVSSAYPV